MANNFETASEINSSAYKSLNEGIESIEKNPILLDKLETKYNFEDQMLFGMNILSKYDNILKYNLVDYECPKKYFYKPEYLCHDLYATTDLWYLLLYVNSMSNEMEFCRKNIKVFPSDMIETINNLLKKEKILIESRKEPIYIDKHYLKNPKESSIDLLADENFENVSNVENNIIYDILSPNTKFTKQTINFYRSNVQTGSDLTVNDFRLFENNKVISLPSNLYNLGKSYHITGNEKFEEIYNTMISLPAGEYFYLNFYNGESDMSLDTVIKNKINLDGTTSGETSIRGFHVPEYTIDMRESHINEFESENTEIHSFDGKNEIWTLIDKDHSKVIFNQNIGCYMLNYDNEIIDNKSVDIYSPFCSFKTPWLDRIKTHSDDTNGNFNKLFYVDTHNRNKAEFLEVTMNYSSNYNTEIFDFSPLCVSVYVEGKSNPIKSFDLEPIPEFNTNGEIVKIKRIIPFYDGSEKFYYQFNFKMKKKKNTTKDVDFKFNFISCNLRGIDAGSIITPININLTKNDYYQLDYNYIYKKNNEGLYFEPILIKKPSNVSINNGIIDLNIKDLYFDKNSPNYIDKLKISSISYNEEPDVSNNASSLDFINISEDGIFSFEFGSENSITSVFTSDLNLPEKYVMNFKIQKKKSKNSSFMMFFDSTEDKANKTNRGPSLVISDKYSETNRTKYPEYDFAVRQSNDGFVINKSGFYVYDFQKPTIQVLDGTSKFISYANTKLVKTNLNKDVDVMDDFIDTCQDSFISKSDLWYFKIIKNGNYLAFYYKQNYNDPWIFSEIIDVTLTTKGGKVLQTNNNLLSSIINGNLRFDSYFGLYKITIFKFLQV